MLDLVEYCIHLKPLSSALYKILLSNLEETFGYNIVTSKLGNDKCFFFNKK